MGSGEKGDRAALCEFHASRDVRSGVTSDGNGFVR
jgi:hypothetical protein